MKTLSFISYKSLRLCYTFQGKGERVLLAFHGFGQDKYVFDELASLLEKDYRFYSFDLFFHGQSLTTSGKASVGTEDWQVLFGLFLKKHSIARFSVSAFSIGARLVFPLIEQFAPQIERLDLIAADGIRRRFLYEAAVSNKLGRFLFGRTLKHNLLGRLSAGLPHSVWFRKFVTTQTDTSEKRQRLYDTWTGFAGLPFAGSSTADALRKYGVKVVFFVGSKDRIIGSGHMRPLYRLLKPGADWVCFEAGHTQMIRRYTAYIKMNNQFEEGL